MRKPTQREQMAYSTIARLETELAQAKATGSWIKCSDRLPDVGTKVLAWSQKYGARESLYREHGEGSIAHFNGYPPYFSWEEPQSNWASSWRPTHWQPLPAPPTE